MDDSNQWLWGGRTVGVLAVISTISGGSELRLVGGILIAVIMLATSAILAAIRNRS